MLNLEFDELKFIRLPVRKPSLEEKEYYLKTYEAWVQIWQVELGHSLGTQDFTKHDGVFALFYRGECVGFCFLKINHQALMCSDFTLSQKFRKVQTSSPWRDLFFHFLVEEFKYSSFDQLVSKTIMSKGVSYASKIFGARKINTKEGEILVLERNNLIKNELQKKSLLVNSLMDKFNSTRISLKKSA